MANDMPYGLSSYVWTENLGRAHRVAAAIEAGMCFVNSQNVRDLRQPFGGTKASAPGARAAPGATRCSCEPKNVLRVAGLASHSALGCLSYRPTAEPQRRRGAEKRQRKLFMGFGDVVEASQCQRQGVHSRVLSRAAQPGHRSAGLQETPSPSREGLGQGILPARAFHRAQA